MFFSMTTKAHVITTALVALMTVGIITLVASPMQPVKADLTARAENGGAGGDAGIGGHAGHGGSGGNTPVHGIRNDGSGNRNDDDGYNNPYGGNGGHGGDAVGGRGGNGDDGADKTIISINKGY